MQNLRMTAVCALVCAFVLLGGCHAQNVSKRQKTNEPVLSIEIGDLRITNTTIELRCEVTNHADKGIWILESMPDSHDARTSTAGILVDADDRTLIVDTRLGAFQESGVRRPVDGPYTHLNPGQSCPAVLRASLSIPDYEAGPVGLLRILGKGVDHLERISFEIGYFTGKDLIVPAGGADSVPQISSDGSAGPIDVSDSYQSQLYQAEQVTRVVVEGICLPCKEWLVGTKQGETAGSHRE